MGHIPLVALVVGLVAGCGGVSPTAARSFARVNPDVLERVLPGAVQIAIIADVTDSAGTSKTNIPVASGTVISPDGLILTNAHAVAMDAHRDQLHDPNLRPFPTRGVPGVWHDPWDADPLEAVVSALHQRNALRRRVTEADIQIELLAHARANGRWEAHVVASDGSSALWPSVNGPTPAIALEAEPREVPGDAGARKRNGGG